MCFDTLVPSLSHKAIQIDIYAYAIGFGKILIHVFVIATMILEAKPKIVLKYPLSWFTRITHSWV